MKPCVIVDIDGTLADCEHRRHFVQQSPKDWDSFFEPARVIEDKLIEPVATVVTILRRVYPIFYVSGRRYEDLPVTIEWLTKHGLWVFPQTNLFVRDKGDFRHDVEVKREILGQIRRDGYEPLVAIDDRNSVVKMWREEGLVCLQAAEGDF